MQSTIRQILMARALLSHASMYLVDLETKADFGRMTDSKGSSFNCSPAKWRNFIIEICNQTIAHAPDETMFVLARLSAL